MLARIGTGSVREPGRNLRDMVGEKSAEGSGRATGERNRDSVWSADPSTVTSQHRVGAKRRFIAMLVAAVLVGSMAGWASPVAASNLSQASVSSPLAWLWANEPTTDSYSPDARYSFNSTGAENTVTRNGAGDYTANFPGVGQEAGTFLVTGQGDAASCTIANWVLTDADMAVNVLCFDATGAAVDSGFSAFYNIPTGDRTGAYLWANEPTTDSYSPDARYSFNSTGAENTVTRTAVGEYTATLPGVGVEAGGFQVTGQGDATSCTIANWVLNGADMDVNVRCFGAGGAAIDSGFLVTYGTAIFETPGAYLWANEPTSDSYTPDTRYQGSAFTTENTVTRTAVGEYTATLLGVGEETGHFQVTGQGDAVSCTITNWVLNGADMDVNVRCYGADGAAIDSGFLVSYNKAA